LRAKSTDKEGGNQKKEEEEEKSKKHRKMYNPCDISCFPCRWPG